MRKADDLSIVFDFQRNVNGTDVFAFSPSGNYVLLSVKNGYQILLDLRTMKMIDFAESLDDQVVQWVSPSFTKDDRIIAANPDGEIVSYDIARNKFDLHGPGALKLDHEDQTHASPDGRYVLQVRDDPSEKGTDKRGLAIYDLRNKRDVKIAVPDYWEGASIAAISPDGYRVLVYNRFDKPDHAVNFAMVDLEKLTVTTHKVNGSFWDYTDWVRPTGQFSPDGQSVVLVPDIGRAKGVMKIW